MTISVAQRQFQSWVTADCSDFGWRRSVAEGAPWSRAEV